MIVLSVSWKTVENLESFFFFFFSCPPTWMARGSNEERSAGLRRWWRNDWPHWLSSLVKKATWQIITAQAAGSSINIFIRRLIQHTYGFYSWQRTIKLKMMSNTWKRWKNWFDCKALITLINIYSGKMWDLCYRSTFMHHLTHKHLIFNNFYEHDWGQRLKIPFFLRLSLYITI